MARDPNIEYDAETEVDLGRHWRTIVTRWWLPLLGIALGIALGFALALGGGEVYRAEATIYLGQPFSPGGGSPVQSLATNPSTVSEIIRSESALKAAAAASGQRVGKLRGKVSSQVATVSGVRRLPSQTALVQISVQGDAPGKTERAANALAGRVVEQTSGYVDRKIETFKRRLTTQSQELTSIERRIDELNSFLASAEGRSLEGIARLELISQLDNSEARRGQTIDQLSVAQQLLALAEDVERARVVEEATAVKTAARSKRTSVFVGSLLGLLLGAAAALAWEPATRRFRPA